MNESEPGNKKWFRKQKEKDTVKARKNSRMDRKHSKRILSVHVQHNPNAIGGVLSQRKWWEIRQGEFDFDEAVRMGMGHVEEESDGASKLVLHLDKIHPNECRRQEVIFELLYTEREYIRDLKIIIEVLNVSILFYINL
jgi:hypothetical protein